MIFWFCIGRAEYGDFIAVEAAMRATYASVLRKTVRWIGQSAGGDSLEMYVVALHCSMSSGLYHYQVRDNALECLRQGDCTQLLLEKIQAEPYVDLVSSSVVLFITGCVERQMIKYGERAYRFMQNEVGSVTRMVTLIAEALELGSCILGGYNDDGLNDFLQVDGVFESVQSVMVVGKER